MDEYVCALDWRYGSTEVKKLFTVANIVKTYVDVELALIKALGVAGLAPLHCYSEVKECVKELKAEEIYEMEAKTGHDIASLAFILGNRCGECGKYIHFGATSYDIVDTAWALILREALKLVREKLRQILSVLLDYARKHIDDYVIGRTHGQHALPITFGFKFANFAYELSRSYERLAETERRIVKLKMSGSVGTMASWGDRGDMIEELVGKELCLEPHPITTQVAPRDAYAELATTLAILGSQLDRFALEIRELSRTEIGEIYEAVERVGSSAMPHKRNPVTAERISSLAKVIRGLAFSALENIPLMHERDLTNSASERIIIPHIIIIVDQMLEDTLKLLRTIKVDIGASRRNLEITRGAIYSEIIVSELVKRGWHRNAAYEKLRRIISSMSESDTLLSAIMKDGELSKYFTEEELRNIMTPEYTTKNIRKIIERTLNYVRNVMSEEPTRRCP